MAIGYWLLAIGYSFASQAYEKVAACYECPSYKYNSAALLASKSYRDYSLVHVVNFENGTAQSFSIENEFESGYVMTFAIETTTPTYIKDAAKAASELIIKAKNNNNGVYDKLTNTLTLTYNVPTSIASSATELRGASGLIKSNLISRNINNLHVTINLSLLSQRAFQAFIEGITIRVEAYFDDQSKATYQFVNPLSSEHPFALDLNSVKTADGQKVFSSSAGMGGRVTSTSITTNGSGGGLTQKCSSYTVSSSSGESWTGKVCWITRTV